jgi:far upstream element-binding protein
MEGQLDQAYQNQFDGPPEAKRSVPDTNSSSATFTDVNGQELTTEEYPVPDNMVGLIIGRGGDQITKIQADTGCRVAVVPQPTGSVTRPCTLTGTTEQILAAKEKLNDIISRGQVKVTETGDFNGYPAPSANELMNQNVAATASQEGNVMEEIVIPHDKCGIVIGKNGNTLRNLRSQFGCSVNLDSTVNSGEAKPLRIAGPPEKVNLGKFFSRNLLIFIETKY